MDRLPRQLLKQVFGYDCFQGGQETAIDTLLAGKDLLAVMPTGAGKSLCYQIPALCLPGITLVVSPLISLMRDQVSALVQAGVPAAYLNSSLTDRQYALALEYARRGRYKLIYIAPERLQSPSFLRFAKDANLSLLAVDEAHCVSQWGPDFRPSYLQIPDFLAQLPKRPPVGAFTATATPRVREDILRLLALKEPERLVTGFDRPKLRFSVQRPGNKPEALRAIIDAHRGQAGIVYCTTRKAVEEVCQQLVDCGIPATRYHAGLESDERQRNQDDFLHDRSPVMVATNAFGMGIDKPNVRYVVHYQIPLDLESYYQEAGRAGRDGGEADCILLYNYQDVKLAEYLIQLPDQPAETDAADALADPADPDAASQAASVPGEPQPVDLEREARRQASLERLRQMTFYATTPRCLRQFILRYFGERAPLYCGHCGNCSDDFRNVDITAAARILVAAAGELDGSCSAAVLTAVVQGHHTEIVTRCRFDELNAFGRLCTHTSEQIHDCIDQLLALGYLQQSAEDLTIRPGALAPELAKPDTVLTLLCRTQTKPAPTVSKANRGSDGELYRRLRGLRTRLSIEAETAPYLLVTDSTLQALARERPTEPAQLRKYSGFGLNQRARTGGALLAEIRAYEAEQSGKAP